MRIAHLVIGGDVAGGQLVALRIARAAHAAGNDVVFVSPTDGPFLRLVRDAGMSAHVVRVGGATDVRSTARLAQLLRRQRIDVVHTHGHFSVNVVGRLAGRLAGARVVSHMHVENAFRAGRLARRFQIALDNATARLCSAIVAVSDATRTSLVRQGYPARKVVTVHNGVEAAADVDAARLDVSPGAPVLLEIGRLCEVKGQRVLVDALARLERDDVVLLLVGADLESGGAFAALIERDAQRLGVRDRVRLLGYRDDVPSLVAAADVLVLPSTIEGLPLVLLEAMAAGRPVVATRVGGVPELVEDGVTGLLVPPGDPTALAAALDELLRDPARARQLGEAGRARVRERFDADDAAQRILRLYETGT